MSASAAPGAAGAFQTWNRHASALEAARRAWSSLSRRHWLVATGTGALAGALYGTFAFLYSYRGLVKLLKAPDGHIFLFVLTRWGLLMIGVACALAFALALLHDESKRAAIRPRAIALTILAVSAFGSLVADPIAMGAAFLVHSSLGMPVWPYAGHEWLAALARMYSYSGEKVLTVVGTVTVAWVYYLSDLRTSEALALVQVGLSRAQMRRLAEELQSAQAMLDPEFVFATLDEVDRRFVGDPQVARRLLDSLIRYLRAALPGGDDKMGTVGQQMVLARAYLDIAGIRSAGRMQAVFDVPPLLERREFPPALIVPLVSLVGGDWANSGVETQLVVEASATAGRLTVEVRRDGGGSPPGPGVDSTLASLRQRLVALYGTGAEVSLQTRPGGGCTAKIGIDEPANA